MFNALLGSFVAWSLTAGALPGPWPAAASLALGGALLLLLLLLLHGHTHGAALTVDVLARRSRFLTVNPGLKLWCCAALLALCLLARTPWPPLALFFAASALTAAGGVRPRAYLSLLGAPAAFLLLSGIALLWEYASAPGGVANVPFLGGYFVLRAPARYGAGAGRGGLLVFPQPVHPRAGIAGCAAARPRAGGRGRSGGIDLPLHLYFVRHVPQHAGRRRQPPGLCRAGAQPAHDGPGIRRAAGAQLPAGTGVL